MNELNITLKRSTKGATVSVQSSGERPWTAAVSADRISDVLSVVAASLRESGWGKWAKVGRA
jgi:hypothetical protein